MTAQISDVVFYKEQKFAITGINGIGLFKPQNYGITPAMTSTGCHRGYYCNYEISEKLLYLKSVYIGFDKLNRLVAKYRKQPKLLGVLPEYYNSEDSFIYENLQERISFTGRLLLGANFMWEMYIHLGFHAPYKFKEVQELIFEEGLLLQEVDLSQEIADFRESIPKIY